MILIALAAAAQLHWTGPHTEQYPGPGYFCGGGYAVQLARGERALVLPQGSGADVQGVRFVLSHGEVNVWTGAHPEPGPVVLRYGGSAVTERHDDGGVSYVISNHPDFGLKLTSVAFRGFKRDSWFFRHADFSPRAEDSVRCLAAYSY